MTAARASLDLLLQGKVTAAEAVAAATAGAAGGGSLTAGGGGYDRGAGGSPGRRMGTGLNQGVDSPPSSQVIAQLQQVQRNAQAWVKGGNLVVEGEIECLF